MTARQTRTAIAGLVILLGIIIGAWTHLWRSTSRGTPAVRQAVRVAAGEASAPNPSDNLTESQDVPVQGALPALKIPNRLPQFSLEDTAGKRTPISAFSDKSLLINFWATWCAPCRNEIPLLETLNTEWANRGVGVVGIAVDRREPVLDFAKRFNINYPLLIGEQDALDAAAAMGVASPVFPFTVFTDRRGEVVALYVGELHKAQAELILGQVESLNQGRIGLAAARQAIITGLDGLGTKPST
jgi:thiol-disulfide isomerase/thioredoxin